MNWTKEAERRRAAYRHLCHARQLSVLAGDRMACRALDDRIMYARWKVEYAEKMQRPRGLDFTSGVARFAIPSELPQDAADTSGRRA